MKLHHAIKGLQCCLAEPTLLHVPVFTVDFAKQTLKDMQDVFQECDVKKGDDKPAPISVDLAAVGDMCKAVIASKKVLDFIVMLASQKG